MTLIDNRIAVLILSVLMSCAINTLLINAQSYFLSFLNPIYTLYISVFSGILFNFSLRLTKLRRMKFSNFSLLTMFFYTAVLLSLMIPNLYSSLTQAFLLFFLAVFGVALFRWIVWEMALHHLDPARAQSHFPFLAASDELGTLIVAISIKTYWMDLGPTVLIGISSMLFIISILFIAFQFRPKTNLEIRFTKKTLPQALISKYSFRQFFILFIFLAVCLGMVRTGEDYLLKIVLKEQIGSYEGIRDMMANYLLITSLLVIGLNLTLGQQIKRNHVSPILLIKIHIIALIPLVLMCLFLPFLYSFVAFEVVRRITENCFYSPGNQMVMSSFMGTLRNKLQSYQGLYYFTIPRILLAILFSLGLSWTFLEQTRSLLILILFSLLGGILLIGKYQHQLTSLLYAFIKSGHKTASIISLQALSFFRPKDYEQRMASLLDLSPKKLLRKTIILGLGYVGKDSSTDLIMKEFASEREEIQIAVLDALKLSQNYEAVRFIYNVITAREKPKSLRVRLNATLILASLYGKSAIPFLLNGLTDSDHRVIANTLETLSLYKDPELIPHFQRFAHFAVPRIRANSLMGLSVFPKTEGLYLKEVQKVLEGQDLPMKASILYIIGKLRDRRFAQQLDELYHSYSKNAPSLNACLAWALIQIKSPLGFDLFGELFTKNTHHEGHASHFLHFYSQLQKEIRFDLMKYLAGRYGNQSSMIKIIRDRLRHSHFDFHEEIEYLDLLMEAKSEVTEISLPKNHRSREM